MSEVTKKCKYCQTDIPVNAKVCPNCKRDLRNWFERHKIITFFLIILFIGMI